MKGDALSTGPGTEQLPANVALVRAWNWMEQLLVLRVENGSGLGGGCCSNYSELDLLSNPCQTLSPFPVCISASPCRWNWVSLSGMSLGEEVALCEEC